jgi:DNA-binding GntR family transcriptional regulator
MSEANRFQLKRDYIVEQLRAEISAGKLKPGQKLRQEELAARFQISSTPVREALRKLEAEGLLTSVPHQGVFVSQIRLEEMEERYRLRILLETYAVKEAMRHLQAAPEQRDKLLNDLEEYQAAICAALEEGRHSEVNQLSYDLHLRLYEEARSPLLKQMILDLWKHFPFRSLWFVPGRAEQAHAEHLILFDAIRQGDTAEAERLLREHLETSARVFIEHFRSLSS